MRRLVATPLLICLLVVGAGPAIAQELSPSPTALEERTEISGTGFVVTFPEDWLVETKWGQLQGVSADGSVWCYPSGERIPEPVDDLEALLDKIAALFPVFSDDGVPMPVIETSEIELPAGRAVRFIADFELDDGRVEEYDARYVTTYILTDGRTLLFLGCSASERPDDDWLSIAETIEFVPEEECCDD